MNRAQWKPNFPAAELKGGALLAHCIQVDVYHALLRGGYREIEREKEKEQCRGNYVNYLGWWPRTSVRVH